MRFHIYFDLVEGVVELAWSILQRLTPELLKEIKIYQTKQIPLKGTLKNNSILEQLLEKCEILMIKIEKFLNEITITKKEGLVRKNSESSKQTGSIFDLKIKKPKL